MRTSLVAPAFSAAASMKGAFRRRRGWLVGIALVVVVGAPAGVSSAATSPASGDAPPMTHDVSFAPRLPTADRFTGKSIRDTRLSTAAYSLSKLIGLPKMVDVACWSKADWRGIEGDVDSAYSTTAFWSSRMPRWVNLSPGICGAMETLLENRPLYANVYIADAVQTLTHELMHALGVSNEAQAECFSMQISAFMAQELGVPVRYALSLARLNLDNYTIRPPSYVDTARCREDGKWDLFMGENSPPWHGFGAAGSSW